MTSLSECKWMLEAQNNREAPKKSSSSVLPPILGRSLVCHVNAISSNGVRTDFER